MSLFCAEPSVMSSAELVVTAVGAIPAEAARCMSANGVSATARARVSK